MAEPGWLLRTMVEHGDAITSFAVAAPHGVDVGAIEGVDESQLACHYCGCDRTHPCVLLADSAPAPADPNWPAGEGREELFSCGWQRIVEFVHPETREHAGYFAVCTNRECVRAYLADAGAP